MNLLAIVILIFSVDAACCNNYQRWARQRAQQRASTTEVPAMNVSAPVAGQTPNVDNTTSMTPPTTPAPLTPRMTELTSATTELPTTKGHVMSSTVPPTTTATTTVSPTTVLETITAPPPTTTTTMGGRGAAASRVPTYTRNWRVYLNTDRPLTTSTTPPATVPTAADPTKTTFEEVVVTTTNGTGLATMYNTDTTYSSTGPTTGTRQNQTVDSAVSAASGVPDMEDVTTSTKTTTDPGTEPDTRSAEEDSRNSFRVYFPGKFSFIKKMSINLIINPCLIIKLIV